MKNKLRIISVVIVSLLAMTFSCKKEVPKVIPSISTTTPTNITSSTVVSGGTISSDGGSPVTSRGVCWSLNQSPTTSDNKNSEDPGIGSFTSTITGLSPNTTYYLRAYATNYMGTAYGSEVSFKTPIFTVTDIDGNVYNTVIIGTQIWMAQNLKTTKYRNGDVIGTTTPATLNISNSTTYPTPIYQWAYGGIESNVATYGRLYTWYAVKDSRKVCPIGWHLPSDTEWNTLITYLGGVNVAGGKLKETGSTHWKTPNTGATNSSGFTALPKGDRVDSGEFLSMGEYGYWWSSTEYDTSNSWYLYIRSLSGDTGLSKYRNGSGFAVRCLKDN